MQRSETRRGSRPAGRGRPLAAGPGLVFFAVAGASAILPGCGGDALAPLGPMLRVSGSFNQWDQGAGAPELVWDGERYRGTLALPGDHVELRLFSPRRSTLIGARATGGAVSVTGVPGVIGFAAAESVSPLGVLTPVATRYTLDLDPYTGKLRVDLAADAEADQPPDAALLITTLRGSDLLTDDEQARRAEQLGETLKQQEIESPLRIGVAASPDGQTPDTRGLTFFYLPGERVEYPPPSVVGNWNGWVAGAEGMAEALGGRLHYLARRASGVRVEYHFDVHGQRTLDSLNPDVIWDGAALPPNPGNLLGGNLGNWNSVAGAPGYVETSARLRQLTLPETTPPSPYRGEVTVYLPPGVALPDRTAARPSLPVLYVLDGKDALVRGRYDVTLDRLIKSGALPRLVAVFVSSPSDGTARLQAFTHDPDAGYPEVKPDGDAFAQYLLDVVVPAVEARYVTPTRRVLLGIDMAGAFALRLGWKDAKQTFARVGSQSGRLGWGDPKLTSSPYLKMVRETAPSPGLERLSFDWSDLDQRQVQVHDALRMDLVKVPGLGSKLLFNKQLSPSTMVWDNWRTQLDADLIHLFKDLVVPPT